MKMARVPWLCLLLTVAFTAATVSAEIVAREGEGYLEKIDGQLYLHLKGDYYQMGYQHGKLLAEQVNRNLSNITENEEHSDNIAYKMYRMGRADMHKRLLPFVPERFIQEMHGIADGAGVDYDLIMNGNFFSEAFHCSGFALMGDSTKDGSLYHVRILDYMTEAGLQDNAVVIHYQPKDHFGWVNVGYAGMSGTVTAMNDQQVAIGEMGGGGQGSWDGMGMSFLLRDVMERASTLDEAVKILKKTPRTCEYYYVVSDAKIPDARGVYATSERIHFSKPGTTYGFFNLPKAPDGDVGGNKVLVDGLELEQSEFQILFKTPDGWQGFLNLQPKDTIIISGDDRARFFMERLKTAYGQVDEQKLIELIKRPVSMKGNLHNAIFHPATGEFWVANAGPDGDPACNQPYHRFTLTLDGKPTALAK